MISAPCATHDLRLRLGIAFYPTQSILVRGRLLLQLTRQRPNLEVRVRLSE